MAEISERAAMFDEIEAHAQALGRLLPKGPPEWLSNELTFGQLRLLFVLGESGPVSIGRLADMLGVTDATASEFVDRVERRGLVVRVHRADDRRVVDCGLSDDGLRLLGQIEIERQTAMRRVLELLTPAELSQFDQLLQTMAERLSAAFPASVSVEGATRVNSGTAPTTPAGDAGGGPA